jgi:AraC-like DNA-binding protein
VTGNRFRVSKPLMHRLEEHGVRLPELLRRAGLPAAFFDADKVLATTPQLFALWRAIGEASADPAIGLKLGAEQRLERFEPISIAAVCSKTFREALDRMARHKRLVCPEEIRVRTSGDEATVEFVFLEADEAEPEVLVDICLSRIFTIGCRGTERIKNALRVELTRPSRRREMFEQHFGCRVKFDAERNLVAFRRTDLDLPFVTYNQELLDVVLDRLESDLKAQTSRPDLRDQIRTILRRTIAGRRPVVDEVARDLGLSVRTLQRRLGDLGVSFQEIVEDTRRAMARHYLRQSDVELKETAYLLGYEDTNSFFRAFQGWEGTTPGAWRSRHGVADA